MHSTHFCATQNCFYPTETPPQSMVIPRPGFLICYMFYLHFSKASFGTLRLFFKAQPTERRKATHTPTCALRTSRSVYISFPRIIYSYAHHDDDQLHNTHLCRHAVNTLRTGRIQLTVSWPHKDSVRILWGKRLLIVTG
jgi:hypothetical protein